MKKLLLFILMVGFITTSFSQKYYTKTGIISFDAGTGLEDIKGINKSSTAAFDVVSGKIQFSTLIKGFEFGSQLMQDHFNENYMESDKFPKSTFSGEINNIKNVNFGLNGTYPVTVKGVIEIHGIKKEITANGKFKIDHGSIGCSSEFIVNMGDFGIVIPGVVSDKLSKTAKININCVFALMK